jgi:hypothetical protein
MNAPLMPEIFARDEAASQVDLPLAAEGVLRYVWEGRFGPMLIEVKDGCAYVNGQPVEPAAGDAAPAPTGEADPSGTLKR